MAKSSKLLTAKQSQDIDIKARNVFGISTLILMENAGRQVAEEAIKILRGRKTVAIFCGKGDNGGDGFVVARHLLTYGIRPDVFLAGKISEVENEASPVRNTKAPRLRSKISNGARINLEILLKLKQRIIEVDEENLHSVKNKISQYALIIDALLGVGLQGEVRGIFRDLISIINSARAKVLAVDIPSGLDANTGKVLGCCVNADKTVTFVAKKRGMVIGDGPKYCGRVVVKDLGVPLYKGGSYAV